MKRRTFIAGLGSAAAWPMVARGQQSGKIPRIGVLWTQEVAIYLGALRQGLNDLGYIEGKNIELLNRFAEIERINHFADELSALSPELLLTGTTPATAALKRRTSTIPIVFVAVSDPVGAGFVETLARPAGNLTGFSNLEASVGGKWLGLLKEVAPALTNAAIVFNPETAPRSGEWFLPSFQEAGRKLGVKTSTAPVHSSPEIERTISAITATPNSGLVIESDSFVVAHLKELIALAEVHKLPAIYGVSQGAKEGGLLSYSADVVDMFRRSSGYVDRILKGEKPADLPVQAPTKFEFVINLKTAKELGLTVPPSLVARADEVIE